jgi:hypothetical protein
VVPGGKFTPATLRAQRTGDGPPGMNVVCHEEHRHTPTPHPRNQVPAHRASGELHVCQGCTAQQVVGSCGGLMRVVGWLMVLAAGPGQEASGVGRGATDLYRPRSGSVRDPNLLQVAWCPSGRSRPGQCPV